MGCSSAHGPYNHEQNLTSFLGSVVLACWSVDLPLTPNFNVAGGYHPRSPNSSQLHRETIPGDQICTTSSENQARSPNSHNFVGTPTQEPIHIYLFHKVPRPRPGRSGLAQGPGPRAVAWELCGRGRYGSGPASWAHEPWAMAPLYRGVPTHHPACVG